MRMRDVGDYGWDKSRETPDRNFEAESVKDNGMTFQRSSCGYKRECRRRSSCAEETDRMTNATRAVWFLSTMSTGPWGLWAFGPGHLKLTWLGCVDGLSGM